MADMDLQIKIEASSDQAVKSIKSLSGAVTSLGSVLTRAGNALDSFEKKSKKFGRDFTQNITAPIAALAGLSLKKIFDEAIDGRGTAAMNEFAASVQTLKRNFDQLLISLGTQLAPIATAVTNTFSNLIRLYQSLDAETKSLVLNFALFAAAVGPVVLAFSTFLSISSKILVVIGSLVKGIGALAAFLANPITLIVALGVALAGLGNIFVKLRQTGSSFGMALMQTFLLVGTAIQKYLVGTFLTGIEKINSALAGLAGRFSSSLEARLRQDSEKMKGYISQFDQNFASAKSDIDSQLGTMGSSAADAFTFGFSTKIGKVVDEIKLKFGEMSQGEGGGPLTKLDQKIIETSNILKQNLVSGLADSFIQIAEGTETAGRAFEKFAQNFLRMMAKMILEAQMLKILQSSMPGLFPGSAAATTPTVTAASGGYISGPGTGTSDSIPARLSNGEYVIRAAAVKSLGVNFLDNLNNMRRSGFGKKKNGVAAFADGGMVTSSAQAPQVIIQNSGTPKESSGTEFDPVSGVTTVILQDIGKNGPISKSIQSNFGVKRGNFR